MLNGETTQRSQHDKNTTPGREPDAPKVRRVRRRHAIALTGPVLLSGICGGLLILVAGLMVGAALMRGGSISYELTLSVIAAAAVGVMAGLTWAILRRVNAVTVEAKLRAEVRHKELKTMMVEQYTGLARLVGQQELANQEHRERVALALTQFRDGFGRITHRIEQTEALVEQAGKGVVGKAVAGDIGTIRAELQVLRRDHDELSEEVGRSKVAHIRSATPPRGGS